MAMRETARSLRAYIIVIGTMAILGESCALVVPEGDVAPDVGLIGALFISVSVAFGLAFVWTGLRCHSLLASSPKTIERVLIAGVTYNVLVRSLLGGDVVLTVSYALVGVLILTYLIRNLRRLAGDVAAPTADKPTTSPPKNI